MLRTWVSWWLFWSLLHSHKITWWIDWVHLWEASIDDEITGENVVVWMSSIQSSNIKCLLKKSSKLFNSSCNWNYILTQLRHQLFFSVFWWCSTVESWRRFQGRCRYRAIRYSKTNQITPFSSCFPNDSFYSE